MTAKKTLKIQEARKMRIFNTKLLKTRKAVSPLIATVLLIAFAVALGAVVMNWGRGYVEDTANMARERSDSEVTCTAEVELSVVEIDSVPQICYNNNQTPNTLEFVVENKKEKEVYSFEARLIGTSSRVPLTVSSFSSVSATRAPTTDLTLASNEAGYYLFNYSDSTYGTPDQVKITPIIKVGANTVTCSSNAETVTDIKPCSEVW